MDDVKNLMTILDVLDTYWDKLTRDLTDEQSSYLKSEFLKLKDKIKSAKNIDEVNEVAKDFFEAFAKLEPLEFLIGIQKSQMRSGGIDEVVEEIKMKIINYCVEFQERFEVETGELKQ